MQLVLKQEDELSQLSIAARLLSREGRRGEVADRTFWQIPHAAGDTMQLHTCAADNSCPGVYDNALEDVSFLHSAVPPAFPCL